MPLTFEDLFRRHWPTQDWAEVTVLVAVSGGADSMALLRALEALRRDNGARLVVGHFNHRLRGADSDEDAEFVRAQAEAHHLEFVLDAAPELAMETNSEPHSSRQTESARQPLSSEDDARRARYQFLTQAARDTGARFVVTAHTADDQAETVLHRVLRGTGLPGLAGIPRVRRLIPEVSLFRPLLWATRQQIVSYLQQLNQPYREDRSNTSLRFTRNRLRRELIPLLEKDFNPQVRQALVRLGNLAAEAQRAIDSSAAAILHKAAVLSNDSSCVLNCAVLAKTDSYVLRQVFIHLWSEQGWPLRAMSADHWRLLEDLCGATPNEKSRSFPGGVQVTREGDQLRFQRAGSAIT